MSTAATYAGSWQRIGVADRLALKRIESAVADAFAPGAGIWSRKAMPLSSGRGAAEWNGLHRRHMGGGAGGLPPPRS